MDHVLEPTRRCKRRLFEMYSSLICRNRKLIFLVVVILPLLYFILMKLSARWPIGHVVWDDHPSFFMLENTLDNKLEMFHKHVDELSANVQHEPLVKDETICLPFVGNGLFGVIVVQQSPLYVLKDRVLTMPIKFFPIVSVEFEFMSKSAKAIDYVDGIAYSFSCYLNEICIISQYYAHRTLPNVFVQDIEIVNPTSYIIKVYLSRKGYDEDLWPQVDTGSLKISKSEVGSRNFSEDYEMIVGPVSEDENDELYVSVIAMKIPSHIYVSSRSKYNYQVLTAICESPRPIPQTMRKSELKMRLQDICLKQLKIALKRHPNKLKEDHVNAWQQVWRTGISVSNSKAKDSLNGDKINATMYYVLSNVRSPAHEEGSQVAPSHSLASSYGCYGNIHHTFIATDLWSDLSNFHNIQQATSYWLLTLQKQGCDNLVKMGALGVMQAMVLSFGSFRFTSQHLEFNMHPKFLHRDYTFRRLEYGNITQINVTVQLKEDNKAILLVALAKSDRPFYACDAGCLDGPVQLSNFEVTQFPVKLTEPVTAILYISLDSKHLDDLHHAIHVHEVVEAPAHEHSVIALHKHGHHLGGLPTFFWVFVGVLIIVFHLFLFKLIYNEYCGGHYDKRMYQDRLKVHYSKL